jgi:hypothetical protein
MRFVIVAHNIMVLIHMHDETTGKVKEATCATKSVVL